MANGCEGAASTTSTNNNNNNNSISSSIIGSTGAGGGGGSSTSSVIVNPMGPPSLATRTATHVAPAAPASLSDASASAFQSEQKEQQQHKEEQKHKEQKQQKHEPEQQGQQQMTLPGVTAASASAHLPPPHSAWGQHGGSGAAAASQQHCSGHDYWCSSSPFYGPHQAYMWARCSAHAAAPPEAAAAATALGGTAGGGVYYPGLGSSSRVVSRVPLPGLKMLPPVVPPAMGQVVVGYEVVPPHMGSMGFDTLSTSGWVVVLLLGMVAWPMALAPCLVPGLHDPCQRPVFDEAPVNPNGGQAGRVSGYHHSKLAD